MVFKAVDKPRKIWHITVALLIAVHLQLNKNNYFNFAEGREREEERSKRSRGKRERRKRVVEEAEAVKNKRDRVRGGCLGAEGRRRTRRPAKRSGGAACER